MYLFGLFNIGKSAIYASQTALSVTGNNIANANTPGYSRQEAVLDVSTPVSVSGGYMGTGVRVAGIRRHYDNFIQSQLLSQNQYYGRSQSLDSAFGQIEQVFNDSGGAGLSSPLADYFNAWQDVSSNPEGQTQRTVLLQKANTLVIAAQRMENGITGNLKSINGQIGDTVGRINTIASEIAALNERISQAEGSSSSGSANDLRDQRQNLLNELGTLTEFSSNEETDGSVNVSMGMKSLVYKGNTNLLSVQTDENGDKMVYLDKTDITSKVYQGQLGGLISARDTIENHQLKDLRKMIASVIKEVNLLHRNGYGLDSSTGNNFFGSLDLTIQDSSSGADMTASITDLSQLTLNEYDISFDGSGDYHVLNKDTGSEVATGAYVSGNPISFDGISVTVSGTVSSGDTFSVSPLTTAIKNFGVAISDYRKIAAATSNSALPGDNSNALNIIKLSQQNISNLGSKTYANYYEGIVSEIGSLSSSAADSLLFDQNMLTDISNRREAISGVSIDEEATNLIKFQRAFQAGAKMIQVTDELLQSILNL
ncbi:MAG TPA: flagellar hook-associated protein FlgK [Thermodesulfovibrionales bacterium]|nr:flagellar hook-associated protein FlgK [Thermodesulfovibrionales bacterium]